MSFWWWRWNRFPANLFVYWRVDLSSHYFWCLHLNIYGYMLYIVKARPNTGKPFKFPTKTWYISQTCHFKKSTPRVSPGVHRNTAISRRRSADKRRKRWLGCVSLKAWGLHKEIPPRVPWSDTHPWLFFCGWGAGSAQNQAIYFKRKKKTSFFNQTSMKTSMDPIWCTKLP